MRNLHEATRDERGRSHQANGSGQLHQDNIKAKATTAGKGVLRTTNGPSRYTCAMAVIRPRRPVVGHMGVRG